MLKETAAVERGGVADSGVDGQAIPVGVDATLGGLDVPAETRGEIAAALADHVGADGGGYAGIGAVVAGGDDWAASFAVVHGIVRSGVFDFQGPRGLVRVSRVEAWS